LELWRHPDRRYRHREFDHHTGVSARAVRGQATLADLHTTQVRPDSGTPGAAAAGELLQPGSLAGVWEAGGDPACIAEGHSWGGSWYWREAPGRAAELASGREPGPVGDPEEPSAEGSADIRQRDVGSLGMRRRARHKADARRSRTEDTRAGRRLHDRHDRESQHLRREALRRAGDSGLLVGRTRSVQSGEAVEEGRNCMLSSWLAVINRIVFLGNIRLSVKM
jgi:hypothetical protein